MYKKKSYYLIISAVLIVVITLLCIFTPVVSVVSSWVGNVLSPVGAFFTNISDSTKGTFAKWEDNQKLHEENEQLKKQVAELENKNKEYSAYKIENERLTSLLGIKNQYSALKPVAASVIAKDAGNWFNVFTVDMGTNDGVVVNDPVINSNGLVGRISQTASGSSKVVTLIDYDHSVSGMTSRTGDLVQIDGDLVLMKSGLCKMTLITEGADVIIGDTIITSGVGGIYPKGLVIGTVTEFKNNSDGTGKYAVVKPEVDFQHVYEVLILTQAGDANE